MSDASGLLLERLNSVLGISAVWRHGPITSRRVERIGSDYGLSGRTYRIVAQVASGARVTLVAKLEAPDQIAREIAFRAANEANLAGALPTMYGALIEEGEDSGLLLLEDICPAEQGDVLRACTASQAMGVVGIIGKLHARTWISGAATRDGLVGWQEQSWDGERWDDRVNRATARYPGVFQASFIERLRALPKDIAEAIPELAHGSQSWIHHDPHLDNVLFRPDGSAVLIDWSGAVIGPPSVDVAVLLLDHAFSERAPLDPSDLLSMYTQALGDGGVAEREERVQHSARLALLLSIRGVIGWCGRLDDPAPSGRVLALRDHSILSAAAALQWIDGNYP